MLVAISSDLSAIVNAINATISGHICGLWLIAKYKLILCSMIFDNWPTI